MKIATIADVHVGNHAKLGGRYTAGINERCAAILAVLKAAAELAKSAGATLVIAGDLLDKANASPQLIRAVMDALGDTSVNVIPGNHDRVTDIPGDHALAPLGALPNVTVYDVATVTNGVLYTPPAPRGESSVEYLDSLLSQAGHGLVHTVVAHFGLPEGHEHPAMRGPATLAVKDAKRLCLKYGVKRLLSGDWHAHKIWAADGVHIEQIGALVPTGWNNPGTAYGKVAIWDLPKGSVARHILPGPRFLTTDDPTVAKKFLAFEGVFVKLTASKVAAAAMEADPNLWVEPKIAVLVRDVDVKGAVAGDREMALRRAADELVPAEVREESLALARAALAAWGEHV